MVVLKSFGDNIALINKAEKILDGSVKEIRKTHRTNTYKVPLKEIYWALPMHCGQAERS